MTLAGTKRSVLIINISGVLISGGKHLDKTWCPASVQVPQMPHGSYGPALTESSPLSRISQQSLLAPPPFGNE